MALFPAYNYVEKQNDKEVESSLSFASFQKDIITSISPQTENNNKTVAKSVEETDTKSIKKKRTKESKKKKSKKLKISETITSNVSFESKDFVIDTIGDRTLLKINKSIFRPKYNIQHFMIGYNSNLPKYQKSKRYFKHKIDTETDETTTELKQEQEISELNAHFNEILNKNPTDIQKWLEYANHQDKIQAFQKGNKKSSQSKMSKTTAEVKLSILNKALSHNINNDALIKEKVHILESSFPADELSEHLSKEVKENPTNLIYWEAYIDAFQCSMANCTVPKVLQRYKEALSKLNHLRRTSSDKDTLEKYILMLLYRCGTFLRQSGLWEQLWTLFRIYLDQSLSINIPVNETRVNDQLLKELEDTVLQSNLPLHELWLRIEKLRENYHWLPYLDEAECEDPQRIVFVEDVVQLVHPIMSSDNLLHLVFIILTTLKVPLLPGRHTVIDELEWINTTWVFDSIECLLPVFYPLYPISKQSSYFLRDAAFFAVGPQYFKSQPGQKEYLDFVVYVMRKCADSLEKPYDAVVHTWWLRFERFLLVLNKQERFKMPEGRNKKTKSAIKAFLKEDDNCNNPYYYREYAFIEHELGNFTGACNIIKKAIEMVQTITRITNLDGKKRTEHCSLYRSFVELLLIENTEDNKQEAIRYLISLISDRLDNEINQETVNFSILKYQNLIKKALEMEAQTTNIFDLFLPDYLTDLFICFGWLLFLTKKSTEIKSLFDRNLQYFEESHHYTRWRKEILLEWYVTVFYKISSENMEFGIYSLFNDVLNQSLRIFPNNYYLLGIATKEMSATGYMGKSWWTLRKLLLSSGYAIPALFLILIINQHLLETENKLENSEHEHLASMLPCFKNRIISLSKELIKTEANSKRCGILWRYYLQFLHLHSDLKTTRDVYFSAIEECPWLKALYVDAAIYVPGELPQTQDIIIEKELRIHITPEELDVLRS